jgi:hypothetical protein
MRMSFIIYKYTIMVDMHAWFAKKFIIIKNISIIFNILLTIALSAQLDNFNVTLHLQSS